MAACCLVTDRTLIKSVLCPSTCHIEYWSIPFTIEPIKTMKRYCGEVGNIKPNISRKDYLWGSRNHLLYHPYKSITTGSNSPELEPNSCLHTTITLAELQDTKSPQTVPYWPWRHISTLPVNSLPPPTNRTSPSVQLFPEPAVIIWEVAPLL